MSSLARCTAKAETSRTRDRAHDRPVHNIEGKIEAMIQSVVSIQTAYARALLVDRNALRAAQGVGDVLGAHRVLTKAYETDVRPALRASREQSGLPLNPTTSFARATRSVLLVNSVDRPHHHPVLFRTRSDVG
jgi:L-rhamnose isomerase/sugar isomerase